MTRYVVKQRYPDSIMSIHKFKIDAEARRDELNHAYQTDNYYVEPYDPQKAATWPVTPARTPGNQTTYAPNSKGT